MIQNIIQIITAFSGTLGFSLVFKSKKQVILINSLGGALIWFSYLLIYNISDNIFLSYLLSATITGIYSEIMARILKTPATTILIPASVALIPGSSLYYTMSALFKKDWIMFYVKIKETLIIATAIALGIIIVSTIIKIIDFIFKKDKKLSNDNTP